MKLELTDCVLKVNGTVVASDDVLIRIASDLSLGDIPIQVNKLGLTVDEISILAEYLEQKVLMEGYCDKTLEDGK
jgi:hypothetical protein